MRGKIRWFSEEQEGGFLLGDDGVDRFVDAEDVVDSTPPRSGDIVEFEHRDTPDGPRAVEVSIVSRSEGSGSPSYDQVTCGVCNQTMVPRYVPDSVYPSLGYFACIYCGSILMREQSSQSASRPRNRRIRNVILIGVVAIPVVVALIAVVLYLTRDTETETPAERHLRIGDEAMEHENYDRAIWAYTEFLNLSPDDATGYAKRGAAYYEIKEYNEAIEDYDRAIAIDQGDSDLYLGRGKALADSGFVNRGLEDLDLALTIDSDNAEAYRFRGAIHWYQGDDELAEADFTSAIQARPNFVDAHLSRGYVRLKILDFTGAVEDYSKVIEIDPNHPVGYAVRGEAYLAQMQYEKAILDFNRTIETAVSYWWNFLMRGRAYYGVGDLENAIKDFDKTLELDPCHIDHHLPMQAALQAYTELIELEPDNARAYLNRALVRAKMEQGTRSFFDFQHAIDRDPELGAAYYFRAYFNAYYPVEEQNAPDSALYENVNQDLRKAKDLEFVPGANMDECRRVINKFRHLRP